MERSDEARREDALYDHLGAVERENRRQAKLIEEFEIENKKFNDMKVWIVCDNNTSPSIKTFGSLKKAQKYVNQYYGFASEDCWIFNKNGSEIE